MKLVLTAIAMKVAALMIVGLHLFAQDLIRATPFEALPVAFVLVAFSYMAMPATVVLLVVALVEIWKR